MQIISFRKWIIVATLTLAFGGCTPTFQNHGYIPAQEDLESLSVGVDTRASVEDLVGIPSTGGVLSEGAYYYVRSRVRSFGPTAPKEIEREVLAISFDQDGVLSNIERFGLEDGKVVPLSRRVTDTAVSNKSFLRQMLGNIGRIGGLNL